MSNSSKRRNSEEEMVGEQIQALIAPPAPDKKQSKASKSWKKKNREYCEACLDGGELICCEKCPLSYHPSCCDPPCDASDLPDKWICKVCLTQKLTLPENELNPLRILDFETGQINPNVFDLEIDPLIQGLAGKIHLPGTTRTKPKNSKSKGVNKRELHEIDSAGLVQLTPNCELRLCHLCSESSRKAQLILCDFCPLLYHLDCLTPPLTNMPRSKWMCPAHPENFFLNTTELFTSQKMSVANAFATEVSHEEVIQNLLKKRSRTRIPDRSDHPVSRISTNSKFSKRANNRTRIVPHNMKEKYRLYRERNLKKENSDLSTFLDSVSKLREDLNQNYSIKEEIQDLKDEVNPEIKALICPIGRDAKPFAITKSFVRIGLSVSCDITISPTLDCYNVSGMHAIIYRDGQKWELLNYSPFGVTVDGVRYGLEDTDLDNEDYFLTSVDMSPIPPNLKFEEEFPDVDKLGSASSRIQTKVQKNYKHLMNDNVKKNISQDEDEIEAIKDQIHSIQGSLIIKEDKSITWKAEKNNSYSNKKRKIEKNQICPCLDPEPGWEAAAPINHGSVLTIGCHQFLFAIIN